MVTVKREQELPDSESAIRCAIGSTVLPFWTENGGCWGRVGFTGMHVVLAVGKKPRHGETRLRLLSAWL